MNHVSSILSNVESIMNNPAIDDSKKLELVMQKQKKIRRNRIYWRKRKQNAKREWILELESVGFQS